MIIRHYGDPSRSSEFINATDWRSDRILLRRDGLRYSIHITTVAAGATLELQYRHHIEAVYCISGHGDVEEADSGIQHPITAGTLYVLDNHDRHTLHAYTDIQGVCIFTPPTAGDEVHDAHGAYPAR